MTLNGSDPRFLQIHTLTSYPASLLNRDDAGFAKRMPFGGAVRTRISSQCLKRHWRVFEGDHSLKTVEAPESVRSRIAFDRYVVEPLKAEGVSDEVARAAALKILGKVFGSEQKAQKAKVAQKGAKTAKARSSSKGAAPAAEDQPNKEATSTARVATAQVTVLGRPELDYLCSLARRAIKEAGPGTAKLDAVLDAMMNSDRKLKENIRALMPGSLEAGLGAALFGRMVTGDFLSRTDAAIHVAHALTVHGHLTESDYFSAIDDLLREDGEQGSGHINASELTSGLFYGYVVVDVAGLLSNLGEDRKLAASVVGRLVHMVATVSPGAKKGATAPYAYSHLVLLESGRAQPRTLCNAFLDPVSVRGSLVANTYEALRAHLADLDAMYGRAEQRAHAGLRTEDLFEQGMDLGRLAAWAEQQVAP